MTTNDNIEVPAGDVLIRKVKGPDGIHERIGYCKVGRIYTVGDQWAGRMVACGEFEFVYPTPAVRDEPEPIAEPERSAEPAASTEYAGD